jgi:hypothetical protein
MKRADVSLETFKEATKRRLSVGTPSARPTLPRAPQNEEASREDKREDDGGPVRKKLRMEMGGNDGMYGDDSEEEDRQPETPKEKEEEEEERPRACKKRPRRGSTETQEEETKENKTMNKRASTQAQAPAPKVRQVAGSRSSKKKRRVSISQSPPAKPLRERTTRSMTQRGKG